MASNRNRSTINANSKVTLSSTTLSLLQECPTCLWRHFRELKRPDHPMPTITTGLDRVMKAYVDEYRPGVPPLLTGKLPGDLAPSRPKGRLTWSDPANMVAVTGLLDDYLLLPGGQAAPLDYKTRGQAPRAVHPSYQLQLDVYSLLLLEAHGLPISDRGFLVYLIPEPGQVHHGFPLAVEVVEAQVSAERAKKLALEGAQIIRQETPPAPAPGCGFCRWIREAGWTVAA